MELEYTLYEHDPDKPSVIVETSHHTIDLQDADDFAEWARRQWPPPRYTVELEPGHTPGS
jgi:hypothetical protein